MRLVWRIIGELWQILLWMIGIGLIVGVIGGTLQSFLGLPVWLKVAIWFAIAALCKHGRDIRSWFEKQRIEARNHPDIRI